MLNLLVLLELEKTEIILNRDLAVHQVTVDLVHLVLLHQEEAAAAEVVLDHHHHLVLDLADLVNFYEKEIINIRFGDTIIVEPLCTIC